MDGSDQYREFVAAVESVEVYLLHSVAKRAADIAWPLRVEADSKLEDAVGRDGRRIVAAVLARVTGRPDSERAQPDGESPGEPHFYVEMTWQVVYTLSQDLSFPDDLVRQFLQRNVVLNVWPYVREYVSSVSTRMNLPALYLPTVRFLR